MRKNEFYFLPPSILEKISTIIYIYPVDKEKGVASYSNIAKKKLKARFNERNIDLL